MCQMSIFVDQNEKIIVSLKFKEILNADGKTVGIKILDDNNNDKDSQECICEALGMDFDNMSYVLENSTAINHNTNKAMIAMSKFSKLVMLRFFKSWNIYDPDNADTPVPVNIENINAVHYKIIRGLVHKWLLLVDGKIEIE